MPRLLTLFSLITAVTAAPKSLKRPDRIVGGTPVKDDEYRWQVSLQARNEDNEDFQHICGGALIAAKWVITAAHCTMDRTPAELAVMAGEKNLLGNETLIPVDKIRRADYDKETKRNDLALLKLSRAATRGHRKMSKNGAQPVQLPSEDYIPQGECNVTGWGQPSESEKQLPTRLLSTTVPVVPLDSCSEALEEELVDGMLCAGGGNTDACLGDSGGPLVCRWNGSQVLAGVVSWGIGCGTVGLPGVYTQVSYFKDWIEEEIYH